MVPLLRRLLLPSATGPDTPTSSIHCAFDGRKSSATGTFIAGGTGSADGDESGAGTSAAPMALFATQLRAEASLCRFLEAAAAAGLRVQLLDPAPGLVFHHLVTEEDPGMVLLHRITAL